MLLLVRVLEVAFSPRCGGGTGSGVRFWIFTDPIQDDLRSATTENFDETEIASVPLARLVWYIDGSPRYVVLPATILPDGLLWFRDISLYLGEPPTVQQ